ncbi:MAG: NAD(P)-binding domain-containing protein [Pseudomonadota bacterium]|nr:NAD(P)-binding domain-containing protein [Pseudomonadota bacterium]
MKPYIVIGAGPMGLCTVRRLAEQSLPVIGIETHSDVGGLWDINSPTSTMYDSAHLISSKGMTEFDGFPMGDDVATYPRHDEMAKYLRDYARQNGLYDLYRFNTRVDHVEPRGAGWQVTVTCGDKTEVIDCAGVLLANGTLHKPRHGQFKGHFGGEMIHSSEYRSADIFAGKRVLIIGCGNSACDIAVDAVHRAHSVDMVVRRGYYFLPKFVAGIPTDTLGGKIRLPNRLKQIVDGTLVRLISGKPSSFGLPDPDYKMYESHPVVNSLFLHHIGHGDIKVRPAIEQLTAEGVEFSDGKKAEYDLILEATGYTLHYPFIDEKYLNWQGDAPALYLNVFTPHFDNLFVMGMVEASGLGWQGRDDQAQLVADFIRAREDGSPAAEKLMQKVRAEAGQRVDGGLNYLKLARMAYYVHKADYLDAMASERKRLTQKPLLNGA